MYIYIMFLFNGIVDIYITYIILVMSSQLQTCIHLDSFPGLFLFHGVWKNHVLWRGLLATRKNVNVKFSRMHVPARSTLTLYFCSAYATRNPYCPIPTLIVREKLTYSDLQPA